MPGSGGGIRTPDLRVMSPTRYQTSPSRDMVYAFCVLAVFSCSVFLLCVLALYSLMATSS